MGMLIIIGVVMGFRFPFGLRLVGLVSGRAHF